MRALIIDTFDNFEIRTRFVYEELIEAGYETRIVVSDFAHSQKKKISFERADTVLVDTKPYKKNLSVARILSHADFAKKVYGEIKSFSPDLIYCIVPLNSHVKYIKKYSKKHNTRVYFDIFDLWPESLPVPAALKKLLFPWKNLRDKGLACAKTVFSECAYYERFLPKGLNFKVAYLCKGRRELQYVHEDALNFLYLGSINNLIDIDGIVALLTEVKKKRALKLSVIGCGASKDELFARLTAAEIPYDDYGTIYDDEEKDSIISRCHYGINMYKKGVTIGLTMKSIEYFCRGLPIVSGNIYDTGEIIEAYGCGYLNGETCAAKLAETTEESWKKMQEACITVHENLFDEGSFGALLCSELSEAE